MNDTLAIRIAEALPGVPVEVWQGLFFIMVAIIAVGVVYLALVGTPREHKAMPIAFMVVGGIYFFAGAILLGMRCY